MRGNKRLFLEWTILVIVLMLSFIMIHKVHYSYSGLIQNPHNNPNYIEVKSFYYPYPIHADEWNHLARGIYILDTKTMGFKNPYNPTELKHGDYELGFHIFLAFFSFISINPVINYQYLPGLFFVINSVFLFMFMRKISNFFIALFSIIFFLVIPSNTNFLGNWFAIPLTFSVFMIYFFFILFYKYEETSKKNYLYGLLVIFFISAITYPFAAILIGLIISIDFIIKNKSYKKWQFYLCLLLFIVSIFFLREKLVFSKSWTSFYYDYSLLTFYGIIPVALAIARKT